MCRSIFIVRFGSPSSGERFWTDSGIDTFMDNLLTPSEEYIFFNSNMLSERLMVITAETEERQEELIHKIYDGFSNKNLPVTIVYQKEFI